ncbi:protein kinase [Streptomyces sp. NBC_01497]|nr:protein kinase [Streptomyces sp. NBC_01497]
MEEYAGRVLADRYRLPLPPADAYDVVETRAFDTYSGQEVLVRQVPLPEVVEAEVVGPDGSAVPYPAASGQQAARGPADPAVRRAIEAAQSAAQVPDHPRLDQVFDVFAEAGSLWIVSELVAARPLAALIAERPLNPYRAAEIASDVLTAVRVLHGHGWVHRNITVRTVLVCDDGRVVLTGLAAGAAEEALCGYAPAPPLAAPGQLAGQPETRGVPDVRQVPALSPQDQGRVPGLEQDPRGRERPEATQYPEFTPPPPQAPGYELPSAPYEPYETYAPPYEAPGPDPFPSGAPAAAAGPSTAGVPAPQGHAAFGGESPYGASSGTSGALPRAPRQQSTPGVPAPYGGPNAQPALPSANSASEAVRAARAGAIAAYRAGARAAARASEEEQAHGPAARAQEYEEASRRSGPEAGEYEQPPRQLGETGEVASQDPSGQGGRGAEPAPPGQREPAGQEPIGQPPAGQGPAGEAPAVPPTGGQGPGPEWWSQPPTGFGDAEGDPEAESDDDDPQLPYRPRLAGTWRDGPAPWNDSAGNVPAGGGGERPRTPALPAGFTPANSGRNDALRADAQRSGHGQDQERPGQRPALPAAAGSAAVGWGEPVPAGAVAVRHGGGPATPLAAERARQARIAVVGAVTERWSPEQAGPVHENWQLAAPIGPATDLWALGALLYRAVQGYAPYPEDSAVELVQLVCSEPPAFAEECGPLRPVVESLLRQDPMERPDFEELRGWLRSLVRSAPEPDAGQDLVSVPTVDGRLPIKRRKGELVRKRRFWGRGKAAGADRDATKHRHKRGRDGFDAIAGRAGDVGPYAYAEQAPVRERTLDAPLPGGGSGPAGSAPSWAEDTARAAPYAPPYDGGGAAGFDSTAGTPDPGHERDLSADLFGHAGSEPREGPGRRPKAGKARKEGRGARQPAQRQASRRPRSLGRTLLVLILLVLVGAIVYAVMFLPKSGDTQGQSVREVPPGSSAAPAPSGSGGSAPASAASGGTPAATGSAPAGSGNAGASTAPTVAAGSGTHLAKGYVLRKDPEGFQIAVRQDWQRRAMNDSGQVRYVSGDFSLIVVPGRDTVKADGGDPLVYQSDKEPELQPFRASTWASASGLRRIDVGQQAMAEGQYTWQDSNGRTVYVRNLAMIIGGRYHVVQVIGPDSQRDEVSEIYQQATASYKTTR